MDDVAIRIEELGKRYRIGLRQELTNSLADSLFAQVRRVADAFMGTVSNTVANSDPEHIWALKNVSLEIKTGEVVGVIGSNGAGKSTLLKILSGITEPTEGRAELRGKIGSLLEAGTGFHSELTGRENTYLNGAILGMKKAEIDRKFDDIVDFAEIGKFIDTPVKRYSSGMTLRLAFSVAAHLDPEILLVDEVLAVGDASFQRRCVGKMDEISRQGRTVLVVSHSMPTISSLTDRCILIQGGRITQDGPTSEVVKGYMEDAFDAEESRGVVDVSDRLYRGDKRNRGDVKFKSVRLLDGRGKPSAQFFEGETVCVEFIFESRVKVTSLAIRCMIYTMEGVWLSTCYFERSQLSLKEGVHQIRVALQPNIMRPGTFKIDLGLHTGVPQDYVPDAIHFRVESSPDGYDMPYYAGQTGLIRMEHKWSDIESLHN